MDRTLSDRSGVPRGSATHDRCTCQHPAPLGLKSTDSLRHLRPWIPYAVALVEDHSLDSPLSETGRRCHTSTYLPIYIKQSLLRLLTLLARLAASRQNTVMLICDCLVRRDDDVVFLQFVRVHGPRGAIVDAVGESAIDDMVFYLLLPVR